MACFLNLEIYGMLSAWFGALTAPVENEALSGDQCVNVEFVSNISESLCLGYQGLMWWVLCLHAVFIYKAVILPSLDSMNSARSEMVSESANKI
jgi:hypothetical protein